jgi:hypothetical protein
MYDNIRKPLMSTFTDLLKKENLFDETVSGEDKFTFVLPDQLNYVAAISPTVLAHYLPVWLKEEFSKRGILSFKISRLQWIARANDLEDCPPQIEISGKVQVREAERNTTLEYRVN